MDAATRQFVRSRANNRCEYCHLPQSGAPFFAFHIEHVIARQHAEDDSVENLALACPDCNRRKGPNLSTISRETGQLIRLFHPRMDIWEEHFEFHGSQIVGRTPIGEATVELLQLNADERLEIREELIMNGDF